MTIRNLYFIGSHVLASEKFIAGTELEVESVLTAQMPDKWTVTEDGSLRNQGKEFISPPLNLESLVEGFKLIHTTFRPITGLEKFSERTSIHVHVNCLDLEDFQVKQIVLWYALFEPVFFAMVNPIRASNIHCVPLDQTLLPSYYKKPLSFLVERWSKYTALNLLPLREYGTIEFRHMEGHDDGTKFEWWLKTLENLWTFGKSMAVSKQVLSDPAALMAAFDAIFKDAPIKEIRPNVLSLISDTLIDVKLAF